MRTKPISEEEKKMNKWEYMLEYVAFTNNENSNEKQSYIESRLSIQGDNGWELIQMDNLLHDQSIDGYLYFKRIK